ncbi:energy-coupling factor ABC transporter ATP-binding protein [Paenibacillus cremeus]|uniref:ATP-binding cassette domain-containing protein n=1 Tax=Paenibacillus cremeus TaxID=2163881 RepID=A0A559KEH3_9BACL|nr:ATP-binding cassette domain-containing protein [Paenibacillus cremeus]TVY10525.1 ATP-binding cassette domain-containing protein [Paenibacillus cremeus]
MSKLKEFITIHQLSVTFPSGEQEKKALQQLELSLYEGQWTAIVGSNGCGKSTLAKVLTGLIPPTSGSVQIDSKAHPAVQMVFQNPETPIIGETVYEDVCFGLMNYGVDAEAMKRRALEALQQVGLLPLAEAQTASLSGGQKQLLNIAGCLALNPPIYVFDEATSMLDPLSRQHVLEAVRKLHDQGHTILWITQLLDELAWCDRVVAIEDGSIAYDGPKTDFFYPASGDEQSVCESLGFVAPYTVKTVQALRKRGFQLNPLPVSPIEFSKAVSALYDSN